MKSASVIYPKNHPNQNVVTGQSQQIRNYFALKLISFKNGQLQISEQAVTKQQANYKITPVTVQCQLQSIVSLRNKFHYGVKLKIVIQRIFTLKQLKMTNIQKLR